MFSRNLIRYIHVGFVSCSSSNKALLSKLRKSTGYTFANCKKALELNDYNYSSAEKWLQEQAQQLGWDKATKLEGRITAQGLVAIGVQKNNAVIVEVNCETDFVARNDNFASLVELTTNTCLNYTNSQPIGTTLSKFHLDSENLKALKTEDGKSLVDHVALVIGKVGENLSLRRATCFRSVGEISLTGYAHPSSNFLAPVLVGKFGAVIAFKNDPVRDSDMKFQSDLSTDEIGRRLCQHIVGMHPLKVGEVGKDDPADNPDNEQCMIFQEYLLDPSQTVGDILSSSSITILDFARYECGERIIETPVKENPDLELEVGG